MTAVATLYFEEQRVGRRIPVMCIFTGVVFYYVCAWVNVCCDPDLSNLIMQASGVAWCGMLVSGLLFGLWGIAGGFACGACYVMRYHHHVQIEQLQRLRNMLK